VKSFTDEAFLVVLMAVSYLSFLLFTSCHFLPALPFSHIAYTIFFTVRLFTDGWVEQDGMGNAATIFFSLAFSADSGFPLHRVINSEWKSTLWMWNPMQNVQCDNNVMLQRRCELTSVLGIVCARASASGLPLTCLP
jgi:hypothetical protein